MSHKQKKRDIANKFLYICPEREKKKIQPADFHTYANIQKIMCIKNSATAGGEIFCGGSIREKSFTQRNFKIV